jgi:UDP-N-acetylmuramyl pentapeptide phosphotransferase/UDP-N-acetylglucosamine-1-phosphate transferase
MFNNLLTLFFFSFITSLLFLFSLKKLFYRWKILDNPIKYKKNRAPIPYSMGVVFFLSFFVVSFLFVEHTYKLSLIWLFGGIITGISFLDDLFNVSPKVRLCIQIII